MLNKKLNCLKTCLEELGTVAVAYSGGVDSTFLAKVARDTLGSSAFAVTNSCCLYPARELRESTELAAAIGIDQTVVELNPLENPSVAANPQDRCYHCKKMLFTKLQAAADEIAERKGLISPGTHIPLLDGSNVSDLDDFRPGAKAVEELGVISPLQDAGLTKADIRDLSRQLGLPTWDKPSFACLASRIPYGTQLTPELLQRIDAAEQLMMDAGFRQVRVRAHDGGALARIEVEQPQVSDAFAHLFDAGGATALKDLGFKYVTLDMTGYRTGSMN